MIFITADTHFYHANIIGYCKRPFVNIKEMDRVLERNWNDTVSKKDIVYHLGDFAFVDRGETERLLKRLHGYKILLIGNHDKSKERMLELGFDEVYDVLDIKYEGRDIHLQHYPSDEKKRMISFCGHVHEKWKWSPPYLNVGVDQWDFRPIPISTAIAEYLKSVRL